MIQVHWPKIRPEYEPCWNISFKTSVLNFHLYHVRTGFPFIPFQVSRQAPIGYVITRIYASDADFAKNAQLSFHIVSGDTDSLFYIDRNLGAVSIGADLRQSSRDRYELLVAVSDAGDPPISANVHLNVVLTASSWSEMAIRQSAGEGDSRTINDVFSLLEFGQHRFILIVLGCVTILIVILLISAIVCVKSRQV